MSEIKPLPSAAREFAALEARLNTGDLTLDEIRNIGDQITSVTTKKTAKLAIPLFEKLESKKELFLGRQVALVEGVHEFSKQVALLGLIWNQLTPDEIAGKLSELKEKVTLISGGELPPAVQKIRDQALTLLEELRFEQVFPGAKELHDDGLEPTFASRMREMAKKIGEQNSPQLLASLNERQQREIRQIAQEGA